VDAAQGTAAEPVELLSSDKDAEAPDGQTPGPEPFVGGTGFQSLNWATKNDIRRLQAAVEAEAAEAREVQVQVARQVVGYLHALLAEVRGLREDMRGARAEGAAAPVAGPSGARPEAETVGPRESERPEAEPSGGRRSVSPEVTAATAYAAGGGALEDEVMGDAEPAAGAGEVPEKGAEGPEEEGAA
jgi:hypothetical protein